MDRQFLATTLLMTALAAMVAICPAHAQTPMPDTLEDPVVDGGYGPYPLTGSEFYEPAPIKYGPEAGLAREMQYIRSKVFCSYWYGDIESMFLSRGKSGTVKLVEQGSGAPQPRGQRAAVLTTDAFGFDYDWGPRFTIGRRLDGYRSIELSYFGLHNWQSTALHDAFDADVPFDSDYTVDFDGSSSISAFYESELHNVELNGTVEYCGSPVTPLLGFRYFNLNEAFDLRATDAGTSDYLIGTENHLIGLQLGGLVERQVGDRFRWSFVGKAGAYVNLARQGTWLRDVGNTITLRDFADHDEQAAFIGELGLNCAYRLSRHLELTAGYNVYWVEGLALAPEQLDFATTAASGSLVRTHGSLFLDAARAGVRIVY